MALPTDINPFVQFAGGASGDLGETIEQSLRFSSSGYLTRGQSSPLVAVNKTFTFSTWFKHGDMGETNIFGIHLTGSNNNWLLNWNNYSAQGLPGTFGARDYTGHQLFTTNALFRDPHAWYHLFLTCSSGVLSLRVNNVLQDQTATQNHSMDRDFFIGSEQGGSTPMDAYLAETYFIQDSVLDPVNDGFIRLNEDGVYVPDTPTISSYGTNGWHLTFDSSQTNGIGHDSSGNGNHFTATGFDTAAISSTNEDNDIDYNDTPTNNYATFTPLFNQSSGITFEHANLRAQYGSTGRKDALAAFGMSSGKYYWEITPKENLEGAIGIVSEDFPFTTSYPTDFGQSAFGWRWELGGGTGSRKNNNTAVTNSHGSVVVGDTVGVLLDTTAGTCTIEINGVAQTSGNGAEFTNIPTDKTIFPYFEIGGAGGDVNFDVNFGQMPFIHEPTGYQHVATNNEPKPAIKNPSDHFQVLSNNGTNILSDAQAAFPTALYLIKGNASSQVWYWIDPMNGTSAAHRTPLPTSTSAYVPYTSGTSYAYIWNCPSTFSATGITNGYRNQTAGFSMVQYTGDDTNPRSIPHGLGKTPGWIILWNPQANDTVTWITGLSGTGTSTENLILNTNEAASNQFSAGTLHAPTDTDNFIVGNSAGGSGVTGVNQNGIGYTAFIWAPIDGYSAMGTYNGDGNTDGRFIYCGFKPKWVLIKSHSADPWGVYDTVRDPANPCDNILRFENSDGETNFGGNVNIDIVSNGFKLRGNNGSMNGGADYQWVAFAESPFGGENTAPATAR